MMCNMTRQHLSLCIVLLVSSFTAAGTHGGYVAEGYDLTRSACPDRRDSLYVCVEIDWWATDSAGAHYDGIVDWPRDSLVTITVFDTSVLTIVDGKYVPKKPGHALVKTERKGTFCAWFDIKITNRGTGKGLWVEAPRRMRRICR
jgi:hypothetical protein